MCPTKHTFKIKTESWIIYKIFYKFPILQASTPFSERQLVNIEVQTDESGLLEESRIGVPRHLHLNLPTSPTIYHQNEESKVTDMEHLLDQ